MLYLRLLSWMERSPLRLNFPSPCFVQNTYTVRRLQEGACQLRCLHGPDSTPLASSRGVAHHDKGSFQHTFLTRVAAQASQPRSPQSLPSNHKMDTTFQKGLIPFLQQQKQQLLFATDFDCTCTEIDSSPILGELGITSDLNSIEKRREIWNNLADTYMEAYGKLLPPSDSVENSQQNTTFGHRIDAHTADSICIKEEEKGGAFNDASLRSLLTSLAEFEIQMNKRVEDSGILRGISEEALDAKAQEMSLRPKCASVLQRLANSGIDVTVISVCWSGRWIEKVIRSSLSAPPREGSVVANDLEMESHTSTGRIMWRVQNALQKEQEIGKLISHAKKVGEQQCCVFVGDSLTDLLALLRADVGIIIGNNASLSRIMKLYGVKTRPLSELVLSRIKTKQESEFAMLHRVNTWEEIDVFLFNVKS